MRYAVLFRGINVGGKNAVKMDALVQMLTEVGCTGVKTYIQSGNAVLGSDLAEAALAERIQTAFLLRFGFESRVMVRGERQIREVVEGLPFHQEEIARAEATDPAVEHLHVYFLPRKLPEETLVKVVANSTPGDSVCAGERELYLLSEQSVRTAKAAIRIARFCPDATARNWKTLLRLQAMLAEA